MTSRYSRGDTGAAVVEIRSKLAQLGLLPDGAADPLDPALAVFDDALDQAVRAFQQQRGIIVDGVVGPVTYVALDEARWRLGDRILSHTVSHPFSGDDVAALQRRLGDMGFDAGRVDGIFGPRTEGALREFQRGVGLVPDGTCGPATLKALDRLARTVVGGRPHALREETALAYSGPALSGKVVVLDPGHGGRNRGVVVEGVEEAAIVEDLASRVEGRLTATGILAFLTRGGDQDLDEHERAAFANLAEADLLISLHVDACPSPRAQGVATFYYGHDRYGHSSAVGERFAHLVQAEIVTRTDLVDCRTHGRTWDLLRRSRMPAVRIELGYLTNASDGARLADPGFRDTIAEAVVVAVSKLYLPDEDGAGDSAGALELLQA